MGNLVNKKYPPNVEKELDFIFSYFPELENTKIFFIERKIKNAMMYAQPSINRFFHRKRQYNIILNISHKNVTGLTYKQLPNEIFIGWVGHELSHIMDYEKMSIFELVLLSVKYLLVSKERRKFEHRADMIAIKKGLSKYLILVKRFILRTPSFSQAYKENIIKYYMTIEEVEHNRNTYYY